MNVVVLYGTESGNSELVAEDIAEALSHIEISIFDMINFNVADLSPDNFYLIICSTYGEGELPAGARLFFAALSELKPDLSGLRYGMFGLGDRSYQETYSQGSEIMDRKFVELGALRIGEYGRHDASSFETASDIAIEWARTIIESATMVTDNT